MSIDGTAASAEDALTVLSRDHTTVRYLFWEFMMEDATIPAQARVALVEDICSELSIHDLIENELFYPAVRKLLADQELVNEADVEHETMRHLLEQLCPVRLDDQHLHAKIVVLRTWVEHHFNMEESRLFPMIRQTGADLSGLGKTIAERKTQLHVNWTEPMLPPLAAGSGAGTGVSGL